MNAVEKALSAGADAVEDVLEHDPQAEHELLALLRQGQSPNVERVLQLPGENAFCRIVILRDA